MLLNLLEEARDSFPASYSPFPPASDRSFWDKASDEFKESFISEAENNLDKDFPVMKASRFMEYHRTGNRTGYQKYFGERRRALNTAIMAELIENKGRFIDQIIDFIWMYCEMTTWIIPAHNSVGGMKHNRLPLPDPDNPIVALMSADIAASLTLAYYFFKDKIDEVSPQICMRLREEINRRILRPYRNHTDYWWMGFMGVGNEQLNNWNPWINSNVLIILLILEQNKEERYYQLTKLTESLQKYINSYPEDGGCDEGPGYWGRAGASAFECLDLLYDFSGGKIDIFSSEKIKNMCRFIHRAHIADKYFVNFADAGPKAFSSPALIYRFGKFIGDENCMAFGSYLYKNANNQNTASSFGIIRSIHEIGVRNEMLEFKGEYLPEKSVFLPQTEVAFLRSSGMYDGIYVAAKGGNNFENHNHNDVGNFIVYGNGKPFIIDAGAMEYTRKTFSPQRYEIWTNCSHWHNVPEVNGARQLCGREHRATNTSFSDSDGIASFRTELQVSYPETSGIKKWERSVSLDSMESAVIVFDEFTLEYETEDICLTMMTLPKPRINGNRIILENDGTSMEILTDDLFEAEFETIITDDLKLTKDWGEHLYRISLKINKAVSAGSCRIVFRLI